MIQKTLRGRAVIALAAASLGLFGTLAPAFALSADAQTIVDQVKASNPDLKPVCSDKGQLTTAVTAAATALASAGKISADEASATAAGKEAGRYLYFHCS
ncbi:hypothetical protein OSH11_19620 [Kaistia dalseonensis]|uniref:Uncharacterized protein n=1 Tax=Kaistia dalseonensis TaxID=410840 RepID=A0ABU0HB57_9HYPH|nr:hypothetical protein [Kaistia dalseonensis]MCX5496923.1 hypothetical protein [Kaistia dalseonensis]MDQ0439548.1 hypothetical protein [Kaistia dalseonensis]